MDKFSKTINYILIKSIIIFLFICLLFYMLEVNLDISNKIEQIVYKNNYDSFEIMKIRFKNDSFIYSHLEQITILSHIFNKNYTNLKKNKNNINICVSLNNLYIYKLIVSIESVLRNCNYQKTFITYHILCTKDITEKSLTILKSFMKRYSLNLEMVIYNMGNNFWYLKNTRLTEATYYRLLLPIFVDLERILYLDADTLTFKDLNEIYQLDFNNTYILGTLDYLSDGIDYLGIKSNKYINAGTILINLEKIRNDKKYYDLINITLQTKLNNDDQTAFNYVLYPKIGLIPFKYNVFTFYDHSDIDEYLNSLRIQLSYKEIEDSIYDPTVIHSICGEKFWAKQYKRFKNNNIKYCRCTNYFCIWISYAKKTGYYKEIISSIK